MPSYQYILSVHSSAVITRSNIVWYYIDNNRKWGTISIRCWIQERHPYLALTGELWGIFCEYLRENWPHYSGTTLYLKSHCGDKRIFLPSYLHDEISHTGKKTSLPWIRAQMLSAKRISMIHLYNLWHAGPSFYINHANHWLIGCLWASPPNWYTFI